MRKRGFALLLAVLMLLNLCACGSSSGQPAAEETAKESVEQTDEGTPGVTVSPVEQLISDAEAGSTEAMCRLGDMYRYGDGVGADIEEARSWYEKAGDAGHLNAYLWLGDTYNSPNGDMPDYSKAYEFYSKAAELGNPDAMANLGQMYTWGDGVEQDYETAAQWYEKAIDAGSTSAMRNLGNIYLNGWLESGKDEQKGVDLLTRAAEAGVPNAYYSLGSYYHYTVSDYRKAEEYYLKAAEADQFQGYRGLGILYMYNLNEFGKAEEYLLKAAEFGDSDIMAMLGDFYAGVGGMSFFDISKAIEWYTKSMEAENPSPKGMFMLGLIYYDGNGVEIDYEKAFDCFSDATEIWKAQNSRDSFYTRAVELIGDMYKQGQGVEKDEEKAAEYYQWAEELRAR